MTASFSLGRFQGHGGGGDAASDESDAPEQFAPVECPVHIEVGHFCNMRAFVLWHGESSSSSNKQESQGRWAACRCLPTYGREHRVSRPCWGVPDLLRPLSCPLSCQAVAPEAL